MQIVENFNIEKYKLNKTTKILKMKVIKEKMNKFIYNHHHLTTKNIIQQKIICLYFLNKYDKIMKNIKRRNFTMKIEKTTKIGRELLEIAPEKAEILLEAGMHCLGCPASQEETIEEACGMAME